MAAISFLTRTSFSISQTGDGIPFDTIGAVGEDVIVVLTNGKYRVFDKTGTTLLTSTLRGLFNNIEESVFSPFDPRVIYDATEQRFFACAADGKAATAGSQLLIAVSKSANPATGGWDAFAVDTGQDVGGVEQHWPDFPMIGLNGSVVLVSLKLLRKTIGSPTPPDNGHNATYVFPKSDLLLATPNIDSVEEFLSADQTPNLIKPIHPQVDLDSDATPHSSWKWSESTSNGKITRWDTTEDSGFSFDEITDIEYLGRGGLDGEQPEGATALEHTADFQISTNPVKIGGFVYFSLATRVGDDSAIAVLKINYTTNAIVATTVLHETDLDLIYPSIAVNSDGDIVVGCTSTGAGDDDFASSMIFVGKDDGVTMTFLDGEIVKEGERIYDISPVAAGRNRWGDYNAVVVDPINKNRFWSFQTWAFDNETNDKGRKIEVTEIITNPSGFFDFLGPVSLSSLVLGVGGDFKVFAEATAAPVFAGESTLSPALFAATSETALQLAED